MAICPFCSKTSRQLGELCDCGAGYTIHTNHGFDPLGLLGKLIANKFIPTAVISDSQNSVYYEAFQPAVDRAITMIVFKENIVRNREKHEKLYKLLNQCAKIKQQNTPNLLEVIDQSESFFFGVTYEALKGEPLLDYFNSHTPDPVALIHIIHQLIQAMVAHHQYGICFPNLGYQNLRVLRSGADEFFLKLSGIIEAILSQIDGEFSITDDIFNVGQIALSMLTGQPMPIENLNMPGDRDYLLPIAQIFMRCIAPLPQRYASLDELLQNFETAFNLNSHNNEKIGIITPPKKNTHQHHSNVTIEQLVWMHRPPQRSH